MKVFLTLSVAFLAKAGCAEPLHNLGGVQLLPLTTYNQLTPYHNQGLYAYQPGYLPVMTQVYDFDGRRSYPNQLQKRDAETDSAFTYSVMAHHPSDDGMEDNRYNVFRMDNQMNRLNMNQRYRMNNKNQMHDRMQYRMDTNQMNRLNVDTQERMTNMNLNDQMDQRMNGQRMQSYRMNQMNRPNHMFEQRINAFNQNQQRTRINSLNPMDEQRMQYRMDTNQMTQMNRNPMTQMNQRNQMNQMNQVNQMTQLNQRNQLNQLDNRRFKRDADSDVVSYHRMMTETPFQKSEAEVYYEDTDLQPIQVVQGTYTHGYTVPSVALQGPFNPGYALYTAPHLMRPSFSPVYMTSY